MAVQKFSKKEAISFGFEKAKQNWKFFIPIVLITLLVNMGPKLHTNPQDSGAVVFTSTIWTILLWILRAVIEIGLISIALKFVDGKKAQIADLLNYKPLINYAIASVLYGLIMIAGLILLIIPGIIWAIKLQYYSYLIIDKNMGPIEALKKSWQITKGVKWQLFLLNILLVLINILGALAFGIGLFITIPTTMIACAKVYRKLTS
ncbi:MAG: DUF975 family protein [Candidatus Daviesbacteria bacterium]|nr:DUF975 family protein [Candidatus Daviesbacteria bacterium]